MAPLIMVAADFLAQQDPGPADVGGVVSHAGADQAILQPLLGPLDLARGLGGSGVGERAAAVLEAPFPRRIDRVGELAIVAPDRIPALDEAEDRGRVDRGAQGQAVGEAHRLQGLARRPGAFATEQRGREEEPGGGGERGEQVLFFAAVGSPEVAGGIVRDELAGVLGPDLAVVGRVRGPFEGVPGGLGAVDDR